MNPLSSRACYCLAPNIRQEGESVMPTILVMSNSSAQQESTVTLAETVEPEQLASEQKAAELIERVGWALTDAKDVEDKSDRPPEPAEERAYVDPRKVEEE